MKPIKAALLFFNGVFFLGGGALLGLAVWVGFSQDLDSMFRLLPSSLPHPLLYYVALASAITGLLCSGMALISFFAMASFNKCLLAAYIFGLIVLLIMESTAVIFLAITPQYLGIEIDSENLIDTWQRNYGVPGKELYTSSIDTLQTKELVMLKTYDPAELEVRKPEATTTDHQTCSDRRLGLSHPRQNTTEPFDMYNCCGVESGNEFSTSWWLLREFAAPGLVVPLSCCVQDPFDTSNVDPVPVNKTLCQDKNPESYRHARHTLGCLKPLRGWVCEQITIALNIGGGTIAFQLLLLLLSIMAAVKLNKNPRR